MITSQQLHELSRKCIKYASWNQPVLYTNPFTHRDNLRGATRQAHTIEDQTSRTSTTKSENEEELIGHYRRQKFNMTILQV
ncbi:CBK_G0011220.mRNA.1.CDS.1 [Saccharomyces cerevisiae]|nr:CBK_G0011220.mRNA.1.CDS.1 [Saccharomyces cerevisiae]CAI7213372.1 CBK_G0011220.mRNA.1.CDS.1 [Saccharomyces cerevisiae]